METNKISVILPVYNGEKYVGNAIGSVLNQSYKNIELIIVNDCSTDNTLQIVENYAKSDVRVKVYSNETNQKLPKTLNNGFDKASGEYLTWTSDDNTYHLDALKKMADVLDNNSDIDLVYSDFTICDMEGNVIKEIVEGEPEEIKFKDNIGACFLYRKSLAAKVGKYDPDTFLAEDYDFFIRCYKASEGGFYHIKEDLYDYGRHDANLSATRQRDIAHKAFDVMMKHYDFLYSQCFTDKEKYRFYDELLALLRDPQERINQRNKFYIINSGYRKYDLKRRVKTGIRSLPNKGISLIKRLFDPFAKADS